MLSFSSWPLYECDYSRITNAILPYYFQVTPDTKWVITPEYNNKEKIHPDYTIFKVFSKPFSYAVHGVVEVKSKEGNGWHVLLEQLWRQADAAQNSDGKLWAIGQKGIEICIFSFDLLEYQGQEPYCFTNFEPLNLDELSGPYIKILKVNFEYCNDYSTRRIALIKWRLDDEDHMPYLDRMFEHIKKSKP